MKLHKNNEILKVDDLVDLKIDLKIFNIHNKILKKKKSLLILKLD